MEDRRLDLDVPLLSVRRFSGGSADTESGGAGRHKAQPAPESRRSSLSFHKPPPGRIIEDKASSEEQSASTLPPMRTGSSVRTRKAVTFAPDAGALQPPLPAEDSSKKAALEKEKERLPIRKGSEEAVTFAPEAGAVKPPPLAENISKTAAMEKEEEQQSIRKDDEEDEDDDAFSDAPDTLSRAESSFMNCSVSGLSGTPESAEPATGFSTDPQVREFMMGRFLPAAKAMASDSPLYTLRKAPATLHEPGPSERVNSAHRRPPVSFQNKPYDASRYVQLQQQKVELAHDVSSVGNDDDEEEEEDYDDAGQLPSQGCGFLPNFCLRSSFFLLNPVPGIKVRGHLPAPPRRGIRSMPVKSSLNGSIGNSEDEHSWEAVYRHKLGHGHYRQRAEYDRSKFTSESNQLTNWSDSPTADGFSPLRHSTGEGISPYREASQTPFHEGKGFLGVPSRESCKSSKTDASDAFEKDGENYWETTPHHSSQLDSGSISPALEKTLYVDPVDVLDTHDPDSSSFASLAESRRVMSSCVKGSEVEIRSQGIKENTPAEAYQADVLNPKVFNFVEPVHSETRDHRNKGDDGNLREKGTEKVLLHLDAGDVRKKLVNPLQPILAPPLPKSPSESWLSRTLPSVASNKPVPQSLLGIGCQRKQALRTPSIDLKQFQTAKPSKPQHRQIRFAEVVVKPKSPKPEI